MGTIYAPNGNIASEDPMTAVTRKMLQIAQSKLLLNLSKKSKLEEIFMINDLRRSCGVDPEKTTMRFRRYGGKE